MLIFIAIIVLLIILELVILTHELNNCALESDEFIEKGLTRFWLFLTLIGIIAVNII